MKRVHRLVLPLSLLVLAAVGAYTFSHRLAGDAPVVALSGHLLISGSSTMTPVLSRIAKRFVELHPAVSIDVRSTGSGQAIPDVRSGNTDIGMISRAPAHDEEDLFGLAIARDGVALVVHKDNPVGDLTSRQAAEIFTGKLTNWRQLGGRDAAISVLMAPIDRGETALLLRHLEIDHGDIAQRNVIGDMTGRLHAIAHDRDAIGYASLGEAQRQSQVGVAVKPVALDGRPATTESIRHGQFPIARPLTLVTKSVPDGLAMEFFEFCLGPEAAELFEAFSLVPYND